jgi:formylmethanofuran dehydrogenase subunit E
MIPFQNFEDQSDPSITAICTNCDWTGPSNRAKHLANEPVCPECKDSGLQLVEEGDNISDI